MNGRAWMLAALSAATLSTVGQELEAAELGGTFEARLVKYGRMPPAAAADLAGRLRGFLTGPLGRGDTDPLDAFLSAAEAIPASMLVGNCMLSFGRNNARGGFGLRVQDCDAYAAAVTRQPAAQPWRPIDRGDWLYGEITAAGVPAVQAKKAAQAMASLIAYAPLMAEGRNADQLALMLACPAPDVSDAVARLRGWHAGATREMALCVANVVGRLGPAEANRAILIDEDVGAAWIRWASAPPGVSPRP